MPTYAAFDFGRAGQVHRRLGEVDPALRQAHELDRPRGRDRHLQRLRVGVADVLGGEHDHPPGDELGILAGRDHHRHVVQGGVGVGAAHALDERRGRVVVAVAALVVDERLLAGGVADVVGGDRAAAGRRRGRVEHVQGVAGVAAGGVHDLLAQLVGELDAERRLAPAHDRLDVGGVERQELEQLAAAEQGRVDLEVRVLGGRADQRHEARLDRRQERVLLALVEAVDLVEEEDRAPAVAAQPVVRLAEHAAHVADADLHGRELLEVRLRWWPRRSGRASSCRSRAARRRSSTAPGRRRSRAAGRCPRRPRRPGRRTRPACAAAAAAPAARPRRAACRPSRRRGRGSCGQIYSAATACTFV